MKINIVIKEYDSIDKLSPEENSLVKAASKAIEHSYSTYSGFSVGAAVMLDNKKIIKGSNQENAAYPNGLCAERVAVFYANSCYPDIPITCLAIVAKTGSGITDEPVTPCGSCRQVLLETEKRFGKPIRIIMVGKHKIRSVDSVIDLLPLSFDSSFLEKT
jgi:cytidine deaminase